MRDKSNFTRRGFVATGLVAAATARLQLAAAQSFRTSEQVKVCKLAPEQEVGPYYVPDELLRSNIVEGKPGVPLTLRLVVMDSRACAPLANAAVDIWHCDALGLYSGFTKQDPRGPGGPGGPPPDRMGPPPDHMGPPPQNHPTDQFTFLRGIQLTDAQGLVTFQTVFPGYYMGRTNHIHFKVRIGGAAGGKTYAGGHTSHTGQVFFPESFAAELMKHEPYNKHQIHRTTQAEDGVYSDQHGELSIARIDQASGLHAELIAAVDPTATPANAGRRMGPPPGSRPPQAQ